MDYKASWDNWTWGLTILALSIIGVAVLRLAFHIYLDVDSSHRIVPFSGIMFFIIIAVLLCYLYSPQKYILTQAQLIIKRPLSNVEINLDDITEVQKMDSAKSKFTVRTFGSGGLFGFYGTFYNSQIGSFTMYATKRSNRILITTATKGKIVITPDDLGLLDKLPHAKV